MKSMSIFIFLTVFFILYAAINYYIFIRGLQSIPGNSPLRVWYIILFIVIALSFFIGRTLENYWLNPLTVAFVWVGAFWFAAILYFIIAILSLDIFRLINSFFPIFPPFIKENYATVKQYLAIGIIAIVAIVLAIGHINARQPRIKTIPISISKKCPGMDKLSIAMISDIHLGTIVGKTRFDSIVANINMMNPDIVLLPGDIVDEDLGPVIKQNLGESLLGIRARYGVYAVTGNHEYIGGVEEACAYLKVHGVRVLRDEAVRINNSFYLVGREDRMINRIGRERRPMKDLLDDVPREYPIILMDHQPFGVEESMENGVDLQVSGHTHHGQLWPLNYITEAIYSVSWGYRKDGNRHLYVSCGVGTWGPPVRLGNVPEVINFHITFQ
jgi:uncharacterized protein